MAKAGSKTHIERNGGGPSHVEHGGAGTAEDPDRNVAGESNRRAVRREAGTTATGAPLNDTKVGDDNVDETTTQAPPPPAPTPQPRTARRATAAKKAKTSKRRR